MSNTPNGTEEKIHKWIATIKAIISIIIAIFAFFGIFTINDLKKKNDEQAVTIEQLQDNSSKLSKLFQEGIDYFEKGQFDLALDRFNEINGDFEKYDEVLDYKEKVQLSYKEDALKKVEEAIANKDYTEAKSVLQVGIEKLDDNRELTDKLNQIKTDEIIEQADKLYTEDGLIAAIQYLERKIDSGSETSQISLSKLEEYKTQYINNTLEEVSRLLSEKEYEKSESIVNEATKVVGSNDELKNMMNEISERKPILLSNKPVHSKGGYDLNLKTITNYKDIFEITYEGVSLYGEHWALMEPFYYGNQYFIEEKCKIFKATLTVYEKSSKGIVTIYNKNGDETLKIGEYIIDPSVDDPYEISVDVQDVRMLVIQLEGAVLANARLLVE